MAQTKDKKLNYWESVEINIPVDGGSTIYAGSLVAINAAGFAIPATDTAGLKFAGVALMQADNANGSDGDLSIRVRTEGMFELVGSGLAQSQVGDPVYVVDDETVGPFAEVSNYVPAGRLIKYISATRGIVKISRDAFLDAGVCIRSDGTISMTGPWEIARDMDTRSNYFVQYGSNSIANYDILSDTDVGGMSIKPAIRISDNVASGYGITVKPGWQSTGAKTLTWSRGLFVEEGIKDANITITNAAGIVLNPQTLGSTNNYGAYIASPSGAASGANYGIYLTTPSGAGTTNLAQAIVGGATGAETIMLQLRSAYNTASTATGLEIVNGDGATSTRKTQIVAQRQADHAVDLVIRTSNSSATVAEVVRVSGAGNVGIGNIAAPTAKLDINSDILRLRTAKTPASAGATGNAGDICWDSSYVYICVDTNTWKRAEITTWV